MEHQQDESVVIQLDDPANGVTRLVRVVVVVLLLALVITPYVLDFGDDGGQVVATTDAQDPARDQICQPAIELPSALESVSQFAVPSFMRLCDWFAPPNLPAIDSTSRP